MKVLGLIILVGTLSACSVTKPVVIVGEEGIMRGHATATLFSGGSFEVSNDKMVCAGSYDSLSMSPTITMIVQCNDGRKGIATVTRDLSGESGHGRVRLSDGMEADLIFGDAAASF